MSVLVIFLFLFVQTISFQSFIVPTVPQKERCVYETISAHSVTKLKIKILNQESIVPPVSMDQVDSEKVQKLPLRIRTKLNEEESETIAEFPYTKTLNPNDFSNLEICIFSSSAVSIDVQIDISTQFDFEEEADNSSKYAHSSLSNRLKGIKDKMEFFKEELRHAQELEDHSRYQTDYLVVKLTLMTMALVITMLVLKLKFKGKIDEIFNKSN